jgi:tetratricopeptide (TPR) repeat protein/predicted Ser/Thr protein kinase
MPPNGTSCLTDEAVADLLERRLAASDVLSITQHIDTCASCRLLVAEAARAADRAGDDGDEGDAAGEPMLPLARGAAVGRYVVVDCIGAGGMGVVYTARDPDLNRKVALKLLRADRDTRSSQASRARLLREAQAMARLSHPNVMPVYDVGTVADEVFLAMELVEGGTLSAWMGAAERPWREILLVLRAAGEGLAAAHAAGLVHRDFKPDNVLIGTDGRVRVTDFGLARAARDEATALEKGSASSEDLLASVTRTGTLIGTPAYMAPEQLSGGIADARSDLFSFCVTLYEALYGARPFAGASLAELAAAIAARAIAPAPAAARVPGWLRGVVVSGLHAEPDARPASLRALLDAIDAGLLRVQRRRARLAAATVVACVAATAVALVAVRARDRGAAQAAAPPASSMSAAKPPTAWTDLDLPASDRPDALRAYKAGLEALRDGGPAANDFAHAAETDPLLASAHLRYALVDFWNYQLEARAHLARAAEHEELLGERDRLLLRAAQAWMQTQPADSAAFVRAMADAQVRYPEDAEIAYWAATASFENGDREGATLRLDRVLALDPSFTAAYYFKEEELAFGGEVEGALATVRDCTEHARNPTGCLLEQSAIDSVEGNCERLGRTAEQLVARDPSYHPLYWYLALAAQSQGKPVEVVRDLLTQEVARAPAHVQAGFTMEAAGALDVLAGDFASVQNRARALQPQVAADSDTRWHGDAALWRTRALTESGRPADAGRVAQDFLRRRTAWREEARGDDTAIARDPTPTLLLAERDARLLSPDEFESQRGAWVAAWMEKAQPNCRSFVWLHGYAAIAETGDDAARALSEQPKYGPMPSYAPNTLGDAFIGKTYLLAGRAAEALPFLERATRSCLALLTPFDHTAAHAALGQALASAGRRDAACAAYAVVLARWGNARPRSVTAEKVRALARGLGCPAP